MPTVTAVLPAPEQTADLSVDLSPDTDPTIGPARPTVGSATAADLLTRLYRTTAADRSTLWNTKNGATPAERQAAAIAILADTAPLRSQIKAFGSALVTCTRGKRTVKTADVPALAILTRFETLHQYRAAQGREAWSIFTQTMRATVGTVTDTPRIPNANSERHPF